MGREHGIESATSGATSTVQSAERFYLVGAPGVGKRRIAEALAERFDEKIAYIDENAYPPSRYALGTVADYRIELALAMRRLSHEPDFPTLYSHSLIDNLAYVTYAFSRYRLGTVATGTAERALLTMTILGTMISDSFKYDHIFFVRGNFDPNEDYDQYQLQTVLQMILDEYQMAYSIIDADETAADQIDDIIEGYL